MFKDGDDPEKFFCISGDAMGFKCSLVVEVFLSTSGIYFGSDLYWIEFFGSWL
jgi:hypothetical protein